MRWLQHAKTGERIELKPGQDYRRIIMLTSDPEHWAVHTDERELVHMDHEDPDCGYLREAKFVEKMLYDGKSKHEQQRESTGRSYPVPRRQ